MDPLFDTLLSHLRNNKLFAGLSEDQLFTLAPYVKSRYFEAQEIIFREGDKADFIYLIEEGEVEISKEDERFKLALLHPGDTFGAIALLDQSRRTASARTATDAVLNYFSISEVQALSPEAKDSIYLKIIQNHISTSHDTIRKSDEKILEETKNKLKEAKAKVAFSKFFTTVIILTCFYLFVLRNSIDWISQASVDSTFITSGILVVFALALYGMVLINGYPIWRYGLNLINWQNALKESLVWTVCFLVGITILKWLAIHLLPGYEGVPLFGFTGLKNYTWIEGGLIASMYAVFAPIQEFVARGVMQGSLMMYLVGKHRIRNSILVTTALFSSTHLHLDMTFAILVIVPSIFWGYMYARHRTLLGVSVSHVLIGLWFIFILGY